MRVTMGDLRRLREAAHVPPMFVSNVEMDCVGDADDGLRGQMEYAVDLISRPICAREWLIAEITPDDLHFL